MLEAKRQQLTVLADLRLTFYRLLVDLYTIDGNLANDHPALSVIREPFEPEWVVALLKSPVAVRILTTLRGIKATSVLNIMQKILDTLGSPLDGATESSTITELRAAILEILVRIAQCLEVFPEGLIYHPQITDTMALVNGGRFSNIYRVRGSGKRLALKEPRRIKSAPKMPIFIREVLLIRNIRHPYILPVYGVAYLPKLYSPCLVMPWMTNETVLSYLRTRRHNAHRLLRQIAQAVAHLHAHGTVHADLRGANTLVDDEGNARLADFGLATFAHTTVARDRGYYVANALWTAPELLYPAMFGRDADDYRPTRATDIYSFGCLCWELYTLRSPFGADGPAVVQVVQNKRPERPAAARDGLDMPDALWELVQRCWAADAAARPTIEAVTSNFGTMPERASLTG